MLNVRISKVGLFQAKNNIKHLSTIMRHAVAADHWKIEKKYNPGECIFTVNERVLLVRCTLVGHAVVLIEDRERRFI